MACGNRYILLTLVAICLLASPVAAFGAGNIASVSKLEGHNWRHGDIEDTIKTVAFLKGHKWSSIMIKRLYFGNWLRDYSQAIDVGSLKGVQAETIRILVWILSFLSFGYATGEFEPTAERLDVYNPIHHCDNPRDYADNEDARKYDQRLRGPVMPEELAIDLETGMKNYIANERGGWATSSGYIKFSLARSIHFGRVYTSGRGASRGNEADLFEALRCLGQALHTFEDFPAHSNYCELVLREMGMTGVFPHCGSTSQVNIRGKHIFPIVTGTFGGVDFMHSVIGEATDHFAQSEVDEVNTALVDAATGKRSAGSSACNGLVDVLSKVPGTSSLCESARSLEAASEEQARNNAREGDPYSSSRAGGAQQGPPPSFAAPPGSVGGPPGPGIPGMNPNFDPFAIVPKIYPILVFRDNVVRAISSVISKVPGLEKLIETITERLTIFVLSLLAPFIKPILDAATIQLKQGSSALVDSSARHQYEPWTDPHCTDPTHSLLSKDHFSNILNDPAGNVASQILKYVAPRVIYAWDHPDVPVQEVLDDVCRALHHPALRDPRCEIHNIMFSTVEQWAHKRPDRGSNLNHVLGSESVRNGKNHIVSGEKPQKPGHFHGTGSHSKVSGSPLAMLTSKRELDLSEPDAAPTTQGYVNHAAAASGGYHQQQDPSWEQQQQQQQTFPEHAQHPQYYDSKLYGQAPSQSSYQYQEPTPTAYQTSFGDPYSAGGGQQQQQYQQGYDQQQQYSGGWQGGQQGQGYQDQNQSSGGGGGWFSS